MPVKVFEEYLESALEEKINEFILVNDPEILSIQYKPVCLAPDPVQGWETTLAHCAMIHYK